jgi:hypothetical protein
MMPVCAANWLSQFYLTLSEDRAVGDHLRDASLASNLGEWTSTLTSVVVRAFEGLGMPTAAKGHTCTVLPLNQQEYLGQDVMAFPAQGAGWRFPAAVCELENAASDDRVAYSLWKVLAIRCQLRLVFCYRPEPSAGPPLVASLGRAVVGALTISDRTILEGETVVIVGSRDEAETFPNGFFLAWKLNTNTGRFERLQRT